MILAERLYALLADGPMTAESLFERVQYAIIGSLALKRYYFCHKEEGPRPQEERITIGRRAVMMRSLREMRISGRVVTKKRRDGTILYARAKRTKKAVTAIKSGR